MMKTCTKYITLLQFAAIILLPLKAVAANSLASSDVPLNQALDEARIVCQINPKWDVMLGSGTSMHPHFGSGSVLIVDKVNYNALKPGMIAIYRDSDGDLVGHSLVTKHGDKWVTRGNQNSVNDPDKLSNSNYLGVVFGIIQTEDNGKLALSSNELNGVKVVVGKKY